MLKKPFTFLTVHLFSCLLYLIFSNTDIQRLQQSGSLEFNRRSFESTKTSKMNERERYKERKREISYTKTNNNIKSKSKKERVYSYR